MIHRLIINADDYGHTPGVSEGIRRAHLLGIVTSTTAMMNRPAAVNELPKAQQDCPLLGLGVHLVLTTGTPLLPAAKIPSLVDSEGQFLHREVFIERLNSVSIEEVNAEWRAQVALFVKTTGKKPDHLDSHHHSSYFSPVLFERMLLLAQELGCSIRNPFADVSAPSSDYLPGGQPDADLKTVIALLERFGTPSPQRFFSSFYDKTASPDHLTKLFTMVSMFPAQQTCELMCHPAVVDDELCAVSDYHKMRAVELAVLTNPKLPVLLKTLEIELVNYSEIKGV